MRPWIIFACLSVTAGIAGFCLSRYTELSVLDLLPPCLFHQSTGLHCPGCGGTRAARALLAGDLSAAIGWNPLLVIGLPLILLAIVTERLYLARKAGWARISLITMWLVLLFFLLRNLPTPSTGWLAPRADLFAEQAQSTK
jgi:hypothetical protein